MTKEQFMNKLYRLQCFQRMAVGVDNLTFKVDTYVTRDGLAAVEWMLLRGDEWLKSGTIVEGDDDSKVKAILTELYMFISKRGLDMTLNTYLEKMSKASGVSAELMLGRSRSREVCAARHIIWSYLRASEKWTTGRIGHAFNRGHATVVQGLKRAGYYQESKSSYEMESKIWEEFEKLIN